MKPQLISEKINQKQREEEERGFCKKCGAITNSIKTEGVVTCAVCGEIKYKEMNCPGCGHSWRYSGNKTPEKYNLYTGCPRCRSTIKLYPKKDDK